MRNSLPCLIFFMIFMKTNTQAQIAFEQYCYVQDKEMMTLVPIFNFENRNHWYVEARYNYEDLNTVSIYLGRTFSNAGKDKLTYSIIPVLGGVMGRFKGGSAGVNAVIEYEKLFFSTQSQYTFSCNEKSADFFFAWSELAYQPLKWFYFGLSAQQTYLPEAKSSVCEPGAVLGFTVRKWTFPLYCFSPTRNSKYFVLGINFTAGTFKRNR